MLELRILSGIHRGAILNLDENIQQSYIIGSYEYADMLLLDPGILAKHIEIKYEDGVWQLYSKGEIKEEDGRLLITPKLLEAMQRMYLCGIWLGIANNNDAWEVLEPLPSIDFNKISQLSNLDDNLEITTQENTETVTANNANDLANSQEIEFVEPESKVDFKSRVLALLGLLSLAGWATANVFFDNTNLEPINRPSKSEIKNEALLNNQLKNAKNSIQTDEKIIIKNYSKQALVNFLDQKIIALDLKQYITYEYNEEGLNLITSLDQEDIMRLERALISFNEQYKPKFVVNIRNIEKKDLLDIKVSQVIYGKLAGIVTTKGERIFIGDEINGYKLIGIQNQKAIFDGQQKIEISL